MIRFDVPRLEHWIWYLFVATVAWQTRLILWQADMQFIEWRSASLYASDVLIAALFILAITRAKGWFVRRMDRIDWLLGLIVAASVLSLVHAGQLTVGIYQLLRLMQGMLFYLYVRHCWKHFDADHTAVAFVAGALLQATLGITQYVLQHDVDCVGLVNRSYRQHAWRCVFYDTHMSKYCVHTGVPHPNVLAAFR